MKLEICSTAAVMGALSISSASSVHVGNSRSRYQRTSTGFISHSSITHSYSKVHNTYNKANTVSNQIQRVSPSMKISIEPAFNYLVDLPSEEVQKETSTNTAYDLSFDPKEIPAGPDPFGYVKEDIAPFGDNIQELVESDHPVLNSAAKHFFEQRHGKRFRPTLVTLIALALASMDDTEGGNAADISKHYAEHRSSETYTKQGQLAQITEMIHVASLIHDDVLDEADTRRGGLSVHKLYSNKVAVLAGDYLLARASVLLARLGDVNVVELMANSLDSLVQGEIMQLKSQPDDLLNMSTYLRKSYFKTASLMAYAAKSCALLGGHEFESEVAESAEAFGYHLGLCYQIVDDVLDMTVSTGLLGKPAMADISLGLATAPVLYAAETYPDLKPIIKRRFKDRGDKEYAIKCVRDSDAVERSMALAKFHAQRAVDAICTAAPTDSPPRQALIRICHMVLTRQK